MRRIGQPEEIADAAVFLASNAAAYVTATTVFVDGGLMQRDTGLVNRRRPSAVTSCRPALPAAE